MGKTPPVFIAGLSSVTTVRMILEPLRFPTSKRSLLPKITSFSLRVLPQEILPLVPAFLGRMQSLEILMRTNEEVIPTE